MSRAPVRGLFGLRRPLVIIASVFLLVGLPIAFFTFRKPAKSAAAWFDSSWGFRQKITVGNTSGSLQSDFQVLVSTDSASMVSNGKLKSDCSDLRFTDTSGKVLPYWIEPSTCNTTASKVWVKVPSIPTSSTDVYMYYGNPSATNPNYKTTDVFIRDMPSAAVNWPLDETDTNQSYARVMNPSLSVGRNLLLDGDMETAGVGNWTPSQNATLTKETGNPHGGSQVIRIAYTDTAIPTAYQAILAIGKTYRVTGYVRSDGVSIPTVSYAGSGQVVWTGTASTDWQAFDVTFATASNPTGLVLRAAISSAGYIEFDDVAIYQVNIPASSGTATNLLVDGNMEGADTSSWGIIYSAQLSKQTTSPHGGNNVLRVTEDGAGSRKGATQAIMTAGKVYRIYGYARSDGNTSNVPRIMDTVTGNAMWAGTNATSWQPFDVLWRATGTTIILGTNVSVAGQYVEFDDVVVAEDTSLRSGQMLQDADMEAADTSSWTAASAAVLTKQTTSPHGGSQVIRATYGGSVSFGMTQTILIVGKTYRVTGFTRSDGTAVPLIFEGSAIRFTGTTSTSWQSFDVTFVATNTTLGLRTTNVSSSGYVEYDDVSVTESNPLVGEFDATATKKPTLATTAGGHLTRAYSFNATNNQYLNLYSTDLNSIFNPNEGTVVTWAKVSGAGVWTDATARDIIRIGVDGSSNFIVLRKDSVNNNLKAYYRAGGTDKSISFASSAPTGWFQFVMTWSKSKDQVIAYYNGSPQGSALTSLGTWSGNLVSAYTILSAASGTPWSGLISDIRLYTRALTANEIADMYNASQDRQAYYTENYQGHELIRQYNDSVTITLPTPTNEETTAELSSYWKLDDGSGTTLRDSTNNGHNGTIAGGATWQTEDQCLSGKCLRFNGTNGYANLYDYSWPTGDYTISLWFKTAGFSTEQGILGKVNYEYSLGISTAGILGFYHWTSGGSNIVSLLNPTPLTANQWYFVQITKNGTSAKMYLNGNLVATDTSVTGTLGDRTEVMQIGRTYVNFTGGATRYFNGVIDEVRVYPYARTATQTLSDYNARGVKTAAGISASVGQPSTNPLNQGLVGYWEMDEATWSGTLNEVVDSSGNGNNGQAQGATNAKAYPGAGKFGNGGYFDGVDDYVTVPWAASLGQGSAQTVSLWFKPTSLPSNTHLLLSYGGQSNYANGYLLSQNGANLVVYWRYGGGTATVSNAFPTLNVWYHLVVTNNNRNVTVYVNGQSMATGTAGANATGNYTTYIGGDNGYWPVNGSLDEVRVYNRVLSPTEVQQLYSWAPGPVGYWKMDERSGTTLTDSSGNGNNIAFTGSPSPVWTSGKYGGAVTYDGANNYSYVSSPASGVLDFGKGDMSISFWMKRNGNPAAESEMVAKYSLNGYIVYLDTSCHVAFYLRDGTTARSYGTTGSYCDGNWHHIEVSSSYAGYSYTYIDGVQKASSNTALANTTTSSAALGVGAYGNGNNKFGGSIDDVKIYNYARTQQQVMEDMNGGHPTGGSPIGSQVAYWKFDEGYGQTANNSIASGVNGTLGSTTGTDANDPAWLTNAGCKVGGCLSFDGSGDYVTQTSVLGNAGTVTFWLKPGYAAGTRSEYYFGSLDTVSNNYFTLQNYNNGSTYWGWHSGSTEYRVVTNKPYPSGWFHVAFVWDTATGISQLYWNDVLVGQTTGMTSLYTMARPPYIGALNNAGSASGYGKALIDDLKIYTSALTPQQLQIDYNANASLNFGTGSASESAQLADGPGNPPIAYWNFESGSGQTLNDVSGNNYSGQLGTSTGVDTTDPTWTTGKLGKALNFDGNGDHVVLPISSSFIPTGNTPITVEGWFKPNAIGASNYTNRAVSIASGPSASALILGFDNSTNAFSYIGATRHAFTAAAILGQWTHLAITFDGTQAQLYRDGKADGAPFATTLTVGDSTTAKLGAQVNLSNYYNGVMDEVKIYNYARTSTQIAYDYNRGAPSLWWKFDECSGNTLHDSANNGYLGTLNGSTTVGTCNTAASAWGGSTGTGPNGKYNGGLNFTASNSDYVVSSNSFASNSLYTVSLWFKSANSSSLFDRGPSNTCRYEPYISVSGGVLTAKVSGCANAGLIGTVSYNTAIWNHVVVVVNGSSQSLYLNGVLRNSSAKTPSANENYPFFIGAASGDGTTPAAGTYFTGQIDDVRVYNYALSSAQVKTLYDNNSAAYYGP